MINENFKDKLDKLLVEGHIDTDEYKQMINSLNKKPIKKSNKAIIFFIIILSIIYAAFLAYQKIKLQQKMQEDQQIEYEFNKVIQQDGLF